ncbi:hypothetical protein [Promicromonospora sp. NFX87]
MIRSQRKATPPTTAHLPTGETLDEFLAAERRAIADGSGTRPQRKTS